MVTVMTQSFITKLQIFEFGALILQKISVNSDLPNLLCINVPLTQLWTGSGQHVNDVWKIVH